MVPWRWWLLPIGILVLMASASALAGPDRWLATVAWADRIRAASPPPMSPSTAAGLMMAARIAGGIKDVDAAALHDAAVADAPPSPALQAQWEALQPAIDRLQLALATAAGGGLDPVVDLAAAEPEFDLWDLEKPIDVLLARASRGRHEDLDVVLQCGNSLLRSRRLIARVFGLSILDRALSVAARAGSAAALPATLDLQVRATHDALAALSDVPTWLGQVWVDMARVGLLTGEELTVRARLAAWQHGFSSEIAGQEVIADVVEQVQAFQSATPVGESWSDRKVRLLALDAADASSGRLRMRSLLGDVIPLEEHIRGLRERAHGLLGAANGR
jgi:hypothetical protein